MSTLSTEAATQSLQRFVFTITVAVAVAPAMAACGGATATEAPSSASELHAASPQSSALPAAPAERPAPGDNTEGAPSADMTDANVEGAATPATVFDGGPDSTEHVVTDPADDATPDPVAEDPIAEDAVAEDAVAEDAVAEDAVAEDGTPIDSGDDENEDDVISYRDYENDENLRRGVANPEPLRAEVRLLDVEVAGPLYESVVSTGIQRRLRSFGRCYESLLMRHGVIEGRLRFEFEIGERGGVTDERLVSGSFGDDEAMTCLLAAVGRMRVRADEAASTYVQMLLDFRTPANEGGH